jgi:hypothetical protein
MFLLEWSITGSMNEIRFDHTATLLKNGKVLVSGGGTSHFLNSSELYDPSTETWTTTDSMLNKRQQHTACTLPNGKVLVRGGLFSTQSFELYHS